MLLRIRELLLKLPYLLIRSQSDSFLPTVRTTLRLGVAGKKKMTMIAHKYQASSPHTSLHYSRLPDRVQGQSLVLFWRFYMKKIYQSYTTCLTLLLVLTLLTVPAFAVDDMWTVANTIIIDVYTKIAGISTVLAGLMSAVAVVGAKLSNNQHKVDQAWDWLKRIWIAWAIINGIGAFIAYVAPLFNGLATLTP